MKQPTLANVLDLPRLSPTAQAFVNAIADRSDLPLRLANMSLFLKEKSPKADARALARAAQALAPGDYRIRVLTDWLNRREAPLWHFGIIHDRLRNETYARALEHFVNPGMTVFEIGTGTGILAMLAVKAGAEHVYTCERRQDVAEAARDIIARNGLSDRITVIHKDAMAVEVGVDLPERADLFVAEIVDNTLLGEGVLPLTERARHHLLKPEAILLPREVSAMGFLITGKGHHEHYRMDTAMGFDLTPFNRFTPVEIHAGKGGGEFEPLTDAVELIRFDLHQDAPSEDTQRVRLTAHTPGTAESLMRWLKLDFGEGILFENRPPLHSSWDPHLHILPTPRPLEAGQTVEIEIHHNRDRLFIWPLEDNSPG
jgi:predicted RNA methylase